jgi:hypothetical protein
MSVKAVANISDNKLMMMMMTYKLGLDKTMFRRERCV